MYQFTIVSPNGMVDSIFMESRDDARVLEVALRRLTRNGVFQSSKVDLMEEDVLSTNDIV